MSKPEARAPYIFEFRPVSKYESRGPYHFYEFEKNSIYRRHVHALMQEIALVEPVRMILDLGAGEGLICQKLRQLGYSVVGWEIDPVALKLAKMLDTGVVRGDMVKDPFPEVDLILAADSLEHLTRVDRRTVLAKAAKAAHRMLVYLPDRVDPHAVEQPSVEEFMRDAQNVSMPFSFHFHRHARYGFAG